MNSVDLKWWNLCHFLGMPTNTLETVGAGRDLMIDKLSKWGRLEHWNYWFHIRSILGLNNVLAMLIAILWRHELLMKIPLFPLEEKMLQTMKQEEHYKGKCLTWTMTWEWAAIAILKLPSLTNPKTMPRLRIRFQLTWVCFPCWGCRETAEIL